MADQDGRLIELAEDFRHNVGVAVGTDHAVRNGRGTETWEVQSECRKVAQTLLEIGSTTPPTVKCKQTRRLVTEHFGEHGAASKRTQWQSILDPTGRNAENTGSDL